LIIKARHSPHLVQRDTNDLGAICISNSLRRPTTLHALPVHKHDVAPEGLPSGLNSRKRSLVSSISGSTLNANGMIFAKSSTDHQSR